jgi:hypothetical protein
MLQRMAEESERRKLNLVDDLSDLALFESKNVLGFLQRSSEPVIEEGPQRRFIPSQHSTEFLGGPHVVAAEFLLGHRFLANPVGE